MMCNSKVIGKPLLLLTNKQDCVAVCSNTQIWEALNVEHVMGRDAHLAQMVGCFLFVFLFASHNLSFSLFLFQAQVLCRVQRFQGQGQPFHREGLEVAHALCSFSLF